MFTLSISKRHLFAGIAAVSMVGAMFLTPALALAQDDLQIIEGASPEPDMEELMPPGQARSVSNAPIEKETPDPGEDLFYDADSLVPSGEMGIKSGPRKVDPKMEPASKLIVVRKNYKAGTTAATLVSADRAMMLGRYDSALEIYNNLYAKNSRDPNILLGRATALQKTGQAEAAIQAYGELLEIRPDNVDAQVNMLGLMGQRYPAVALRRLMDLQDQYPNNVGVIAQIAVMQAQLGDNDEAIKYLGMAAGMEPRNANHLFNLAVIADRTGAKKEAIKYYEQALEVDTIYGGSKSIPRDAVFERMAQLR